MSDEPREILDSDIAIVGYAARLPGAKSIDEFWQNLRDGVECQLAGSTGTGQPGSGDQCGHRRHGCVPCAIASMTRCPSLRAAVASSAG